MKGMEPEIFATLMILILCWIVLLVLDLAVELPVYQRDVLYAFNGNVLNADTMTSEEELNPFSSPLDRIWEIELKAN